ncbi:MAG: hypothetical protein RLY31_2939 [Bacteroidota bacterium]
MRLFHTFLLACLGTHGFGQVDLLVSVLEPNDEPAAQIIVHLRNQSLGIAQSGLTDPTGKVVFRSLPIAEEYFMLVPANLPFGATTDGPFNLRSNQERSVGVVLREDTHSLTGALVKSFAASGTINSTYAEVSHSLDRKELERLPAEGRDLTRELYRLPYVAQATGFFPKVPNVSINDANPLFNSYLIDGLDYNERFLGGQKFSVTLGFAKDVTVLTNNYSAAYGLFNNGAVKISPHSGSNVWEGEAFEVHRPGPALDAEPPFPQRDLSGNPVRDGFRRYPTGVAMGGPIRKDRTFFYLDPEHTMGRKKNRLHSPALRVDETIRGANRFSFFSGKIYHIWNKRFRSYVRANVGLVGMERQGGGLEGGVTFPSAANFQDRNSVLLTSRNNWVGGKLSAETNAQFARFRWNYARVSDGGSPQVQVLDPQDQTVAVLGHPGYVFEQTENTFQFQQKVKYYLPRHVVQAAFSLVSARHDLFGGGNVNGNYMVRLDAAQLDALAVAGYGSNLGILDLPSDAKVSLYQVELRPTSLGKTQHISSGYLKDRFDVTGRLTGTMGLRYDYDNLSKGGVARGDRNNLAPRLNANYRLGQRSLLRGGYGTCCEKILYAVYSDALQQNTTSTHHKRQLRQLVALGILPADTNIDRITFAGNLTASLQQVPYLKGPDRRLLQGQRQGVFSNDRRILNPNGYDNPLTHQFGLGYQYQPDSRRLFQIDLIHNRAQQLFRLRNLNATAPYPLPSDVPITVRTTTAADASRPVPVFESGYALTGGDTLQGVARNIILSETAGESRYYAGSVSMQQNRNDSRFAWRVNYTMSCLENNMEDINFRAMDGNDFDAEWGPGINDRRHQLNAILTCSPADRLDVTATALFQSGQPVNRIPDALVYGTTDLYGDGASFGDAHVGNSDRHPGEHRNSDRLPGFRSFDLGFSTELHGWMRNFCSGRMYSIFSMRLTSVVSATMRPSTTSFRSGPPEAGLFGKMPVLHEIPIFRKIHPLTSWFDIQGRIHFV